MDIIGIIISVFVGSVVVVVSLKMQNEEQVRLGEKLGSINHGLVDNMSVKVGISGGLIIGIAVGVFIGMII